MPTLSFMEEIKDKASRLLPSPFTQVVEEATSQALTSPDYENIMFICDEANRNTEHVSDVVRAVRRRIDNNNPKVQYFTVLLLDALIKNCYQDLHDEVADNKALQRALVNIAICTPTKDGEFEAKKAALTLILNMSYWFIGAAQDKTKMLTKLADEVRNATTQLAFEDIESDPTYQLKRAPPRRLGSASTSSGGPGRRQQQQQQYARQAYVARGGDSPGMGYPGVQHQHSPQQRVVNAIPAELVEEGRTRLEDDFTVYELKKTELAASDNIHSPEGSVQFAAPIVSVSDTAPCTVAEPDDADLQEVFDVIPDNVKTIITELAAVYDGRTAETDSKACVKQILMKIKKYTAPVPPPPTAAVPDEDEELYPSFDTLEQGVVAVETKAEVAPIVLEPKVVWDILKQKDASFWQDKIGREVAVLTSTVYTSIVLQCTKMDITLRYYDERDDGEPVDPYVSINHYECPVDEELVIAKVVVLLGRRTPAPRPLKDFSSITTSFMNRFVSGGIAYTGEPASTVTGSDKRTVTVVTGPSGSGKTTLCEQQLPRVWGNYMVVSLSAAAIKKEIEVRVLTGCMEAYCRAVAAAVLNGKYTSCESWARGIIKEKVQDKAITDYRSNVATKLVGCIKTHRVDVGWTAWRDSKIPERVKGIVVVVDEIGPHLDLAGALVSAQMELYANDWLQRHAERVELVLCGTGLEQLEDEGKTYISSDPSRLSRVHVTGPTALLVSEVLNEVTQQRRTPVFDDAIRNSALFNVAKSNARLLVLACYYMAVAWHSTASSSSAVRLELRDHVITNSLGVDGFVELALLDYCEHNGLKSTKVERKQAVDAALVELIERVIPIEDTDLKDFLWRLVGPGGTVAECENEYVIKTVSNNIQRVKEVIEPLFMYKVQNGCIHVRQPRYPAKTIVPVTHAANHPQAVRNASRLGLLECNTIEAPTAMTAVATFAFGAPRLALDGYALERFTAVWTARLVALRRGWVPPVQHLSWQLPANQKGGGPTLQQFRDVMTTLNERGAVVLLNGPSAPGPDVMLVEREPTPQQPTTVGHIMLASVKRDFAAMVQQLMDMGCMDLGALRAVTRERIVHLASEEPMLQNLGDAESILQLCTEKQDNTNSTIGTILGLGHLLYHISISGEYRRSALLALAMMCVDVDLEDCDTLAAMEAAVREKLGTDKCIRVTLSLVSGGGKRLDQKEESPEPLGWEKCVLAEYDWVRWEIRRSPAVSFGPLSSLVDIAPRPDEKDTHYFYFPAKGGEMDRS